MPYPVLNLRRAVKIHAANRNLSFAALNFGVALRTMIGHLKYAFVALACIGIYSDDGWNDFTGFFNDDSVSYSDVLAFDFIFVMQGGSSYSGSRDKYGFEFTGVSTPVRPTGS